MNERYIIHWFATELADGCMGGYCVSIVIQPDLLFGCGVYMANLRYGDGSSECSVPVGHFHSFSALAEPAPCPIIDTIIIIIKIAVIFCWISWDYQQEFPRKQFP